MGYYGMYWFEIHNLKENIPDITMGTNDILKNRPVGVQKPRLIVSM